MSKEIKKITLGGILGWFFGIIFALAGMGAFISLSIVSGVILFVIAAAVFPPMDKLFKENLNFELSRGMKIAIVILGVIALGIVSNSENENLVESTAGLDPSIGSIQNEDSSDKNFQQVENTVKNPEPEAYYAGDKVIVGNFAYTVNSYKTTNQIGDYVFDSFWGEKADGIFIVLDVTVENIANEPRSFSPGNIEIADDKGRTFEHDSSAEFYIDSDESFFLERIQPGLSKTGKIVFDVPEDLMGTLKISADDWSNDVKYVSWNKKQ